jgi:peptidoglycan-associated lipoprotein
LLASLACSVVVAGSFAPSKLRAQTADAGSETAAELLEDGLDAIADHADDSGRRLLSRVLNDFPGSPEANKAKRALLALDKGELDPEDRARIKADEAERTTNYRHAFLVDVGDRVFFAENSSSLGGRARAIIAQQAKWLAARPDLSVKVIGRADGEGNAKAARGLSLERAQAVRDALVAAGVQTTRIELKAVGDDDRVAVCNGPECSAQNRNAEVLINYWHFGGWEASERQLGLVQPSGSVASRVRMDVTGDISQ